MAFNHQKIHCGKCKDSHSCFAGLNEEIDGLLRRNRLELHFRKGEIICKQGSFASDLMYIQRGIIKTYHEGSTKKNTILSVLPAGQVLGLTGLFSDQVYDFSAAALEDCIICSVDKHILEESIFQSGKFGSAFIKLLNSRLNIQNERFLSFSAKQMNGRMADALLYLSERVYGKDNFTLSLSRNDLSELTNISPESVTRILTRFKKEGIISINGKHYTISDPEKLRIISEHS